MNPVARIWLRDAVIVLLVGAGLAFLGPFGTYADLTPFERTAYWIGLTVLMWLQTAAAFDILRRLSAVARLPVWAQAGLAALAGAVPTTFEVAWVEGVLRVGGALTPRSMLETYAYVAVIAVGLFVPLRLLRAPARLAAPEVEIEDRVPPELALAVALAAEDHYLRVYTEAGERLIHHRFSQAVGALGARGLQVHRSWWVARNAVERAERTGDRYVLVLTTGLRVPVSRTFGLAAREAGLLPRD